MIHPTEKKTNKQAEQRTNVIFSLRPLLLHFLLRRRRRLLILLVSQSVSPQLLRREQLRKPTPTKARSILSQLKGFLPGRANMVICKSLLSRMSWYRRILTSQKYNFLSAAISVTFELAYARTTSVFFCVCRIILTIFIYRRAKPCISLHSVSEWVSEQAVYKEPLEIQCR